MIVSLSRTMVVVFATTAALALPASAKTDDSSAPAAPAPAPTGGLIMADDGQAIAAFLRGAGYRAEVEMMSDGRPRVMSAADGLNFSILLRDCTDGRACTNVQFHSAFTMQTPPSVERLGEWNNRRIVGQAFMSDEGQPRLGHFVTMRGGLSTEAFEDAFGFFREALTDFAVHIGFR